MKWFVFLWCDIPSTGVVDSDFFALQYKLLFAKAA